MDGLAATRAIRAEAGRFVALPDHRSDCQFLPRPDQAMPRRRDFRFLGQAAAQAGDGGFDLAGDRGDKDVIDQRDDRTGATGRRRLRAAIGGQRQIEKLVPQPQEAVALGLTTRNEAPIRSSTKSTSEPARNGTDAASTSTTARSRAITRSSSALLRSMSNLY